MHSTRAWLSVFLIVSSFTLSLPAQEWTRFRGPNGQGIATATSLPVQWTEKNVRWRAALPQAGHSSPVLWGDKLFITCAEQKTGKAAVLALDAHKGTILWQQPYDLATARMHSLNHYAAATPVVDDKNVYVLWPTAADFLLVCLDHNGQEQWQKSLGPVIVKHGPCVSPTLYEDMIIVPQESESNEEKIESRWLALGKDTGDIRWEKKRSPNRASYMTPCVYTTATGTDQLIFNSLAYGITAVAPRTGDTLWERPELFAGRTIWSPVIVGDRIVGTSGAGSSGKVLVVVQAGTAQRPAKVLHRLETKLAPFGTTGIAVDGKVYTFHDMGTVSCWDIEQGKALWSEKTKHKFYGSPIALDKHIYCINTKGEVVVLQAGAAYQELAVNPLGEESQATPAVAHNRLYLRTLTQVVCIQDS